jgi:hypothetical protein
MLRDIGHHVATPSSSELDLFDADKVREIVRDTDAVLHLATRIPSEDRGVALRLVCTDRKLLRPRPLTATTLTCILKMRAERSWPSCYARAGSTTSAMTTIP